MSKPPDYPPPYSDDLHQPMEHKPPMGYPAGGPGYGQQPPYPPQQMSYAPQQPLNPPQQPSYAPQQPSYPPQQQPMLGYHSGPPVADPNFQYNQNPNTVVVQPMLMREAPPLGAVPPNYLMSAIAVTLCCFWPTGIIAIIKASGAKNSWSANDYVAAESKARTAKRLIIVSIIIGIIVYILFGVSRYLKYKQS